MKKSKKHTATMPQLAQGFTLLEMLLSVAIISLIGGLSVPVYQSLQVRNELDVMVAESAQAVRSAQVFASAVREDAKWGVYITADTITIFKGDSYAGRDSDFDELVGTADVANVSGTQEFVFTRVDGRPESTGSITFETSNGTTRTVTINEMGTLSY